MNLTPCPADLRFPLSVKRRGGSRGRGKKTGFSPSNQDMRTTSFLLLILFLDLGSSQAAFENSGASAKRLSLGNSSVALTDEPSAFLANPGALGFLGHKGIQAGLARLYDLDELAEAELSAAFPFGRFHLGAAWSAFGKADYYRESQFNLACAYTLTDHLSFGLNAKLLQVSFSSGYGSLSALSVDVGSVWKANGKVQLGLVAGNLNQPELVKGSNDIPTNFCLGLAVFPFKEVTLLADLSYEDRYKEQLHLGQEIMLVENLPLRFGIQTAPARYALGAGFELGRLIFDYAYVNHSVLGNTHKISFSYLWGKNDVEQSP